MNVRAGCGLRLINWAISHRGIVAAMRIGDYIRRKDLPAVQVHITGEDMFLDAWVVEFVGNVRQPKQSGRHVVFKDDARWETIQKEVL